MPALLRWVPRLPLPLIVTFCVVAFVCVVRILRSARLRTHVAGYCLRCTRTFGVCLLRCTRCCTFTDFRTPRIIPRVCVTVTVLPLFDLLPRFAFTAFVVSHGCRLPLPAFATVRYDVYTYRTRYARFTALRALRTFTPLPAPFAGRCHRLRGAALPCTACRSRCRAFTAFTRTACRDRCCVFVCTRMHAVLQVAAFPFCRILPRLPVLPRCCVCCTCTRAVTRATPRSLVRRTAFLGLQLPHRFMPRTRLCHAFRCRTGLHCQVAVTRTPHTGLAAHSHCVVRSFCRCNAPRFFCVRSGYCCPLRVYLAAVTVARYRWFCAHCAFTARHTVLTRLHFPVSSPFCAFCWFARADRRGSFGLSLRCVRYAFAYTRLFCRLPRCVACVAPLRCYYRYVALFRTPLLPRLQLLPALPRTCPVGSFTFYTAVAFAAAVTDRFVRWIRFLRCRCTHTACHGVRVLPFTGYTVFVAFAFAALRALRRCRSRACRTQYVVTATRVCRCRSIVPAVCRCGCRLIDLYRCVAVVARSAVAVFALRSLRTFSPCRVYGCGSVRRLRYPRYALPFYRSAPYAFAH